MADFFGERGRENGYSESDAGVPPSDAPSQGSHGHREPGPATATGGLQTIRQAAEATAPRPRLLGMDLKVLV